MGNSFIGFPVPRAKIADMIAGAAPPLIHHTDHENGGADEVDCTGLTGAGGITLPFDDIYINELIQAKNCLYQYVGSSGVISEAGDNVKAGSGTDLNSYGEIYKNPWPYHVQLNFSKKRTVIFNVNFDHSSGANDEFWIVSGKHGNEYHIGFKVISQVLYGTCYKYAESVIALTGGANPSFVYSGYSLKFVYDGVNSVKFYVDGALRGEITTNLPSGTSYANRLFNLRAKTLQAGSHADIRFNSFMFYQEA